MKLNNNNIRIRCINKKKENIKNHLKNKQTNEKKGFKK